MSRTRRPTNASSSPAISCGFENRVTGCSGPRNGRPRPCVDAGSDWERRHLLLRDWLRRSADDREAYADPSRSGSSRRIRTAWMTMRTPSLRSSPRCRSEPNNGRCPPGGPRSGDALKVPLLLGFWGQRWRVSSLFRTARFVMWAQERSRPVRQTMPGFGASLAKASELLGPGRVLLQVWSSPVVEWVFVGLEDDAVVVSDNGQTFGLDLRAAASLEPYLPWSVEKARLAARRFGVEVADESGDGYQAFRLTWALGFDDSPAGTGSSGRAGHRRHACLAHSSVESPTYDSYFWERSAEDG